MRTRSFPRPAAFAAIFLLSLLANATATSLADKFVTEVAGLAAKADVLVTNKTGLLTPPRVNDADQLKFPDLPLDKAKAGFKCGAGLGMCPVGHCCRCAFPRGVV